MSPRRSSRALTSQPPSQPHGNNSVSSSSSRQDRMARLQPRQDSGSKSPSPQSSSDGIDGEKGRSTLESRQTRRTRQQELPQEEADVLKADQVEEEGDEEEVTRCVCRKDEYPGPPVPLNEGNRTYGFKDSASMNGTSLEALPDDAGSLFIQCDVCKVWQHGGCVGIMDEETTPENYFCEECRSDFHRIMIGARGQRYSKYLPLHESSEPQPPKKHSTPKESENRSSKEAEGKNGSNSANSLSAKRRSTMNSRAAWQEEEELQRVLEASKTEGGASGSSNGHRKGKRIRDDSEETKQNLKRRKTGSSGSESPPPMHTQSQEGDSDNEDGKGRLNGGSKKARARVAEGYREKELRDKERQKERDRAEAAGRRKGRADRRHADESEPPENQKPGNSTTRTVTTAGKFAKPQISSKAPPPTPPPTNTTVSHKKNGRPPARRGRIGRNQYTRDRDATTDTKAESPRPSHSRDSDENGLGIVEASTGTTLANGSKPSKPRHMNPNRTSMNDLRKRAAGIMEFISRTQVEMAGEQPQTPPPLAGRAPTSAATPPSPRVGLTRMNSELTTSKLSRQIDGAKYEDKEEVRKRRDKEGDCGIEEGSFEGLSSLQMMDVLTRELVLWQKEHGKWGER